MIQNSFHVQEGNEKVDPRHIAFVSLLWMFTIIGLGIYLMEPSKGKSL